MTAASGGEAEPQTLAGRVRAALPSPAAPGSTPADFVLWFMKLLEMAEGYSRLAKVYHEVALPRPSNPAGGMQESASARGEYQQAAQAVVGHLRTWLDKVEELNRSAVIAPFSNEIQQFLRMRLTVLVLELAVDKARFRFDKYNPWWNAAARAARQTRLGTSEKFLDDARLDALHLFEQSRRTRLPGRRHV